MNMQQQAPQKKVAPDDIMHRTPPASANQTNARTRGMVPVKQPMTAAGGPPEAPMQHYAEGTDNVQNNSKVADAINNMTPQGAAMKGFTGLFGAAMDQATAPAEPQHFADGGDVTAAQSIGNAAAEPALTPGALWPGLKAAGSAVARGANFLFGPGVPPATSTPLPQTPNEAANVLSATLGVPAHLLAAGKGMINGEPAPVPSGAPPMPPPVTGLDAWRTNQPGTPAGPQDPLTPNGGANTTFLGENFAQNRDRYLAGQASKGPVPASAIASGVVHPNHGTLIDAHTNPGAYTPEEYVAVHQAAGITNNEAMKLMGLLHQRTAQESAAGSYLNRLATENTPESAAAYEQTLRALATGGNFGLLGMPVNPYSGQYQQPGAH